MSKAVKILAVIPARYGSTRFPGKALAALGGKPVIQQVWERAVRSKADAVAVATDDSRIFDAVAAFGGKAVMTAQDHPSGSDRVWEVAKASTAEIIVNIQGDEPFVEPEVIDALIDAVSGEDAPEIATAAVPCPRAELERNPNIVKVVMTSGGCALYFSRAMIPFLRTGGDDTAVYRHWGIYAYRRAALAKFVVLPEGQLERCEKLEQLRALEHGMRIKIVIAPYAGIGIDTPDDLARAENFLAELKTKENSA